MVVCGFYPEGQAGSPRSQKPRTQPVAAARSAGTLERRDLDGTQAVCSAWPGAGARGGARAYRARCVRFFSMTGCSRMQRSVAPAARNGCGAVVQRPRRRANQTRMRAAARRWRDADHTAALAARARAGQLSVTSHQRGCIRVYPEGQAGSPRSQKPRTQPVPAARSAGPLKRRGLDGAQAVCSAWPRAGTDRTQHTAGRTLLESVGLGDPPGVGMVMIGGVVRCGRSRKIGRAHV